VCEGEPSLKEMLGHDGPPTNYYRENLLTAAPLAECPLRTVLRAGERNPALVRELARAMDEQYPMFDAGLLLNAGGTADQPARYLALMNTIRSVRAQQQAKWEEINRPPEETSPAVGA
jgi:hypothetical protein